MREHLRFLFFQSKLWLDIVCIDLHRLGPLFSIEAKTIPDVKLGTQVSNISQHPGAFRVWGFIADRNIRMKNSKNYNAVIAPFTPIHVIQEAALFFN